jgi:hypothetical protein
MNCSTNLFVLLVHSFRKFLLQQHHDLLYVLARHHFQSQLQSLSPHIQIRARQHAQDLHGQVVQDALVVFSQLINLIKNDKLDIVVCLLDGQLYEFPSCGLYRNRIAR